MRDKKNIILIIRAYKYTITLLSFNLINFILSIHHHYKQISIIHLTKNYAKTKYKYYRPNLAGVRLGVFPAVDEDGVLPPGVKIVCLFLSLSLSLSFFCSISRSLTWASFISSSILLI